MRMDSASAEEPVPVNNRESEGTSGGADPVVDDAGDTVDVPDEKEQVRYLMQNL